MTRRDRGRRRAELAAARAAAIPAITYPPQLPVSERRDEIADAVRDHQVVIVAGETGSGKTTQLPKICLELGRGVEGMIGHTQPRRLAARTVAARIADELDVPLGGAVGYAVRFDEQSSPETSVKLMTDGILLTEIQRDRDLRRYDTIIVDEAHERSLNIDFLLGYLRRLLPRRPDLKVIITSATIDAQRFAEHFGGAPVIEVSGRTYPVELRYRPVVDPDDPDSDPDRDLPAAICAAADELRRDGPGDILVFLSGEREIRDIADALVGHTRGWREDVEVLPLYSRLAAADQQKVFAPHARRRIVLATNVAETSLTVPGIHYVIDPGTARISRYSTRTKVQRLPIEPVSRASADQRSGRCGRVADGVCIRLYSQEDYESRPRYTEPEIRRTNLASVILQMALLRMGDIEDFPFVEPPDRRQIADGIAVLRELGALEPGGTDGTRLTAVGRTLAQLPIDPRLARMIVEADRLGCLREVLVIAAGLAIQDPRERPAEHQDAADAKHRRFSDPSSDFVGLLALWAYVREQRHDLSGNRFRRLCRDEYLNWLRLREWSDVESQLRHTAADLGMRGAPGPVDMPTVDAAAVHQALLSGLLSHVGLLDERTREYQGARGTHFAIFPGSALARKRPTWVVAAELVETSRLFARTCARVDPAWVERVAGDQLRRSYSEPRWSKRRGAVVATERVTLYGLPLITDRTVVYGRIDPVVSRELFIRHALVEGEWAAEHRFLRENAALRDEAEALEERSRRRGLVADDETLFAFYDARIPPDIVSGRHFDAWWKRERRERPDLLTLTPDLLVTDEADAGIDADYPQEWTLADGPPLPLTYVFEPTDPADGVTVHVPLALLGQLDPAPFEWLVPGLREELVTALIRALPKPVRRLVVPAPDVARAFLAVPGAAGPAAGRLTDLLGTTLRDWRGVAVTDADWNPSALPAHLRMTFRVEDESGAVVGVGKDLGALQDRLAREALAEVVAGTTDERSGLTTWDLDRLEPVYETERGGRTVRAFPALVDDGGSVAVRLLATAAEARQATRAAVVRLLLLALPSPMSAAARALEPRQRLALSQAPHPDAQALLADCLRAAVEAVVDAAALPGTRAEYDAVLARARAEAPGLARRVLHEVAGVLDAYREASGALAAASGAPAAARDDVRAQLDRLVHDGFVAPTGAARLRDLERYLRAITVRLDGIGASGARDAELMARAQLAEHDVAEAITTVGANRAGDADVIALRWLPEELRVSFFAQRLGTRVPVSDQRVQRAVDAVLDRR